MMNNKNNNNTCTPPSNKAVSTQAGRGEVQKLSIIRGQEQALLPRSGKIQDVNMKKSVAAPPLRAIPDITRDLPPLTPWSHSTSVRVSSSLYSYLLSPTSL
ncbi:hypothetical protein E2C01_046235 [Portunus trituberculatus]|uniref:Uncharacterized protein n=1 Tax=Portunus trituberculatus TaxID=210409 RepID=A0A5B7G449_PORTR|nr:hypothetical protein [Portunus trituberculatus]